MFSKGDFLVKSFDCLVKGFMGRKCWIRRKCWLPAFFSYPQCFHEPCFFWGKLIKIGNDCLSMADTCTILWHALARPVHASAQTSHNLAWSVCKPVVPCWDKTFEMFKILVMTKFCDRVVNYAQTVREHQNDEVGCVAVCAMPWLSQTATKSSRKAHFEFTSISQAVHEQFTTTAQQWRLRQCMGIYRASWTLLAIPEIASKETTYITETTCHLKQSRKNGMTSHDKNVAKSHASVSLALKVLGPYSPTIFQNILCLFLQDFVTLNVTQLLIG